MNIVQTLANRNLISPPKWLPNSVMYLTIMGSEAYGVSSNDSDRDVYGFCVPPREVVFPHLTGEILGFGKQVKRFSQWQEHHIHYQDDDAGKGRDYDLTVYSIVKYFQLCMDNNPNMIDSLFTPPRCHLTITQVGQMVYENRRLFLHKGCWHKFKGYAYAQLHKMDNKNPVGKRKELVEEFGYDVKFAYHLVRLLLEVEQILAEGDLDLERPREQLKAIRRGEWTEGQIRGFFHQKETELEKLYNDSTLPWTADEGPIKELLLECLNICYGEVTLKQPGRFEKAVREIQEIVGRI